MKRTAPLLLVQLLFHINLVSQYGQIAVVVPLSRSMNNHHFQLFHAQQFPGILRDRLPFRIDDLDGGDVFLHLILFATIIPGSGTAFIFRTVGHFGIDDCESGQSINEWIRGTTDSSYEDDLLFILAIRVPRRRVEPQLVPCWRDRYCRVSQTMPLGFPVAPHIQ